MSNYGISLSGLVFSAQAADESFKGLNAIQILTKLDEQYKDTPLDKLSNEIQTFIVTGKYAGKGQIFTGLSKHTATEKQAGILFQSLIRATILPGLRKDRLNFYIEALKTLPSETTREKQIFTHTLIAAAATYVTLKEFASTLIDPDSFEKGPLETTKATLQAISPDFNAVCEGLKKRDAFVNALATVEKDHPQAHPFLEVLPKEVAAKVLTSIDSKSLGRLGQTSKSSAPYVKEAFNRRRPVIDCKKEGALNLAQDCLKDAQKQMFKIDLTLVNMKGSDFKTLFPYAKTIEGLTLENISDKSLFEIDKAWEAETEKPDFSSLKRLGMSIEHDRTFKSAGDDDGTFTNILISKLARNNLEEFSLRMGGEFWLVHHKKLLSHIFQSPIIVPDILNFQ